MVYDHIKAALLWRQLSAFKVLTVNDLMLYLRRQELEIQRNMKERDRVYLTVRPSVTLSVRLPGPKNRMRDWTSTNEIVLLSTQKLEQHIEQGLELQCLLKVKEDLS